jgi:hypothetical protein
MSEFYDSFAALTDRSVALVHAALGLEADSASAQRFERATSSVRLNHYPVGAQVIEPIREGPADHRATARSSGGSSCAAGPRTTTRTWAPRTSRSATTPSPDRATAPAAAATAAVGRSRCDIVARWS